MVGLLIRNLCRNKQSRSRSLCFGYFLCRRTTSKFLARNSPSPFPPSYCSFSLYEIVGSFEIAVHSDNETPLRFIFHDSPSAQLCAALRVLHYVSPCGVRSGHPVVSFCRYEGNSH